MARKNTPIGIGIDAEGNQAIDPTKNVEALVKALEEKVKELRAADNRFLDAQLSAENTLQNFARDAESKLQNFARDSESKLHTALLDAETRRIDQLAMNSRVYQETIRDMLAESVRTTSDLVSNQLVQIQATFNERVSKLEAYQFTQAGRSSVSDPATSDALSRMASGIASLSEATNKSSIAAAEAIAKLASSVAGSGGNTTGRDQAIARVWTIIAVLVPVASLIIALVIAALEYHK